MQGRRAWQIKLSAAPVKDVARTLKVQLGNLLTYFTHAISNTMAEGFNSNPKLEICRPQFSYIR
jgi:transposase